MRVEDATDDVWSAEANMARSKRKTETGDWVLRWGLVTCTLLWYFT